MKIIQILITFILFQGCIKSSSYNYHYEDNLFQCLSDLYEKENIDLSNLISEFEEELKSQKLLEDNSGKSYLIYIDNIFAKKNMTPPITSNIQDKFLKVLNPIPKCIVNQKDTLGRSQSRFAEIAHGYQNVFHEISNIGELDPFNIGKKMVTMLTKEDLDHNFYKISLIHSWISAYKFHPSLDRGISIKLPPWSDEEPDLTKLKERNVLTVLVNEKNKLIVRNKKMNIKNLTNLVKVFIANPSHAPIYAERPDRAIISLKNDRGTEYEKYLEVYNEIKRAYNELWDEESLKDFGKKFDNLNREEQKSIQSKIPLVISEAEPTAFGEEE